jgi:hypothetical protein
MTTLSARSEQKKAYFAGVAGASIFSPALQA